MKVSQPVAQAYFETTDNRQFSFTSAGGTQSIEISSNVDWHVETTPSWITCSPKIGDVGKRTLTIKVDKNPNAKERSFTIIIQANNGKSISVSVRQDAGIVAPNENDNELPKQK